jgi:Fe-S-cluster containining protein
MQEKNDKPAALTLERLEEQVERGSLFTHTALSQNAERLEETASFTYGMLDALLAKGVLTGDEVAQATEKVRAELAARKDGMNPNVALRIDPPEAAVAAPVEVNCAERYPVCQAICCKLDFALTAEEIEGGHVKWDLGRPYYIRRAESGHCVHLDTGSCRCGVYADRPGICRQYSCAKDERIWKDFEKMELNTEWLGTHFKQSRPRLLSALMRPIRPQR